MIKVLIIDDEPLVRMGMKSIIAWEEHGFHIVGEAGNGKQGLEKIMETRPELVLVDIMMPQMDGIEVIREAKKSGFNGKFIILSCVSEIEYLQQAIRLGVSSYLLKSSVTPQGILELVEEAAKEIQKGRILPEEFSDQSYGNTQHFAFNEFLNLILKRVIVNTKDIREKMQVFGFDERKNLYLLVSLVKEGEAELQKALYRMAAIGESLLDEGYWGSCFVNFEDYLVMLIACDSMKEAEELSFRLNASAKQCFDVRLITAARKIDLSQWDIGKQYEEASEEISAVFFESKAEKKEKGEWIPSTEYANFEKLSMAIRMIKNMMLQSRMISETEAKKVYAGAVEYVMFKFELAGADMKEELEGMDTVFSCLNRLDSFEKVHQRTLQILEKCYELAGQKGFAEYEDELTDVMIQYIHNHCNSKISAKDVAEHVHFSVDYTCKYFKKKTSTNLTDYILKLKIYRSHEELMEGKSIAEIAEKYGFSSDGHYLKVFKKYEGITPGAFVKRMHDSG